MYKPTNKELLELRKKIFLERGIPALEQNGFKKSPFSTAWYGKNNLGDYTYELCRVTKDSTLNLIEVHISKVDMWVKIFFNIFKLFSEVTTLEQLQGIDGLKYYLPPNSLTKMRLRIDGYNTIPLFRTKEHKLKSFSSENGLNKRSKELGDLIAQDLTNIDEFIKRWHELHQPNLVDWEGNKI